jgi:hypothetical protein
MCQCATATGAGVGFRFWQRDIDVGVRFDGGQLTSDGGLPWVVQAEQALGVCAALAAEVPEWRRGGVRHSLEALVRQRVFQIACGYEDQNDATTLRADPLFKLACGRLPASEPDLASQPTRTARSASDRSFGYSVTSGSTGAWATTLPVETSSTVVSRVQASG